MIATGLPDVVSFPMGFDMFGLLGLPDAGPGRLGEEAALPQFFPGLI